MTIDTRVSLGALLGVLVTLGGLVLAQGRSLGARIDVLRTESRAGVGRLDDHVEERQDRRPGGPNLSTG